MESEKADKSLTEIKYRRKKGEVKTTGIDYENKVAVLLYFRAVNKQFKFRIGIGVENAGKFDDIVINFADQQNSKTLFIQLKHKEDLCSTRSKREFHNFFNVEKYKHLFDYFTSFCGLKEFFQKNTSDDWWGNFENSCFVLFTNVKLDHTEFLNYLQEYDFEDEDILRTKGGCCYKLKKEVMNLIKTNSENLDDFLIEEFIQKFVLYTDQVSEKEMDSIINDEIIQGFKVSALGASEIRQEILNIVKNLRNEEYSNVLTEHSFHYHTGDQLISTLNSKECSNFEKCYVEFNDEESTVVKNNLYNANKPIIFVETAYPIFISIIIYKILIEAGDNPVIISSNILSENRHIEDITKAWPSPSCKHVIVCIKENDAESSQKIVEYITTLLNITKNSKRKIVIATECNELVKHLHKIPSITKEVACDFIHLSDDSKDKIMNTEISFQGFPVKLKDIVKNGAETLLNGAALNELLFSEEVYQVGGIIESTCSCYVSRKIHHNVFINENILNDANDDVLAITPIDENNINALYNINYNLLNNIKSAGIRFNIPFSAPFPISACYVNPTKLEARGLIIRGIPTNATIILPSYEKEFHSLQNATFFRTEEEMKEPPKEKIAQIYFISNREQFETLCKTHGNVHWLVETGKEFLWKETKGNLSSIQKYVSDIKFEYTVNTLECIPGKVSILLSEAGMGKSTLLKEMAFNTKKNNPTTLLIQLNLPDSIHFLKRMKDSYESITYDDILDFMLSSYGNCDMFWRRLCQHSLETHEKIVLLIDGFDEICPEYEEVVSDLLVKINHLKIYKIWITARSSAKHVLQKKLQTLSCRLHPFSTEDQKLYFLKYLSDCNIEQNKISSYVDEVVSVFKDKTFLGIPFHCKIVAEMIRTHLESFNKKIVSDISKISDEIYLYETFVEQRFLHYCKRYSIFVHNTYILEKVRRGFLSDHMYAAVKQILLPIKNINLREKVESKEINDFLKGIEDGKENTELIDFVLNGRPQFVHRKFAEFLTAKYLFENYLENMEVLDEILVQSNPYFSGVQHMLNLFFIRNLPLHNAVYKLEEKKVTDILKKHKEPNTRDALGRTALHIAVCSKQNISFEVSNFRVQNAIIKSLLNHKADVNVADAFCKLTPFQYLTFHLSWDIVETFLETKKINNEDINNLCDHIWKRNECIFNAARYAVIQNKKKLLNFLLNGLKLKNNKINLQKFVIADMFVCSIKNPTIEMLKYLIDTLRINWKISLQFGDTILHYACRCGNLYAVQYIIEKCKIDPNIRNLNGDSALALAASNNHLQILKYFNENIKIKMDRFVDDRWQNPLHCTSNLDCTKYLVEKCNVNPRQRSLFQGSLPIHNASMFLKWEIVEYYVEKCNIDINVVDTNGQSVLHKACQFGEDVKFLLERYKGNIEINLKDIWGRSPFLEAILGGKLKIAKMLADLQETDTNIQDNLGYTGLHYAVLKCITLSTDIIEFFIRECQVDPKIRNFDNQTALDIALERNNNKYMGDNEIDDDVIEYLKCKMEQ